MSYIVYEGCDASGKDFLRKEFERRTGYQHNVITRLFASQLVYSAYYKRPLWTCKKLRDAYVADAKKFMRAHRPLIVMVSADDAALRARMRVRGENPLEHPDPQVARTLFRTMLALLGIQSKYLLEIDTTGDPDVGTLARVVESRVRTLENGRRR